MNKRTYFRESNFRCEPEIAKESKSNGKPYTNARRKPGSFINTACSLKDDADGINLGKTLNLSLELMSAEEARSTSTALVWPSAHAYQCIFKIHYH